MFNSNRERGLSWIRSSSSNDPATFRRRTKSLDRFNQKVEKSLQKTIQKNELKRNIIFKVNSIGLMINLNLNSFIYLTEIIIKTGANRITFKYQIIQQFNFSLQTYFK